MANYKSFNTEKNKIFKNWQDNIETSNEIIKNGSIDNDLLDILNNLKEINIFEKNYFILTDFLNSVEVENIEETYKQRWDIDIGIIPISFISFIRVVFESRNGSGDISIEDNFEFGDTDSSVNMGYFFSIEESVNDDLKYVTLHAEALINNPNYNMSAYQLRLNISLINPQEYI